MVGQQRSSDTPLYMSTIFHSYLVGDMYVYCCAEELEITLERSCRFYEILAPYFRKVMLLRIHTGLWTSPPSVPMCLV